MYTVAETHNFINLSQKIWSDEEKDEFINFLAQNPLIGDVIPKTGGFRKVRWTTKSKGKRGGARVIYYNFLEDGFIVCFTIYTKNKQENITPNALKGKQS